MCVCIYIYMCVCVCVYVYLYIQIFVLYINSDIYNIYKYCIYTYIHKHMCVYIQIHFLKTFYIGVWLINNLTVVSGVQQRDSAIHKYVSILPQTPLPSRLPQNIKQSSLCCTVGPCWLSILNIAVCTCPSQTP